MNDTNNSNALEFLNSRLDYERLGMPKASSALGLQRTRRLLKRLGDPQDALRIWHIAGTKGKGSTATLLAQALMACGKRVGLFCSPHLHFLEERFQINGQLIDTETMFNLIEQIRPSVEAMDHTSESGLTFFEITTALGLLHFAQSQVEHVVLEVGLGGRLDSTNVVRPDLSIITSISFDHTKILGDTLGLIAREKAGIIKRRTPTISGVRGLEARTVIHEVALQRKAPFRQVDDDYQFEYAPPARPLTAPQTGSVRVKTWRRDWGRVALPMFGPHQADNLALVLASLDFHEEITGQNWSPDCVLTGLAQTQVPARVEILGQSPLVIVDGAHNVASAQALATTLEMCFPPGPRTLIYGGTRDKDVIGQLRELVPAFSRFIATRYVNNPRALPPEPIAEAIRSLTSTSLPVAVTHHPKAALDLARDPRWTPPEGIIVITGSLFLAAESRAEVLGLSTSGTVL